VELDADLMITLTNVDGVFSSCPGQFSSQGDPPKLLHTFNPDDPMTEALEYAIDLRVGRGGMAAKVDAATFALNHGVPSVICNGHEPDILQKVVSGKAVGTFFTKAHQQQAAPFVRAMAAKEAGRVLSSIQSMQRKKILEAISEGIKGRELAILEANARDVAAAERSFNAEGWTAQKENLLARLVLTQEKLHNLVNGVEHLFHNVAGNAVGNNLKWCKVADGLYLEQESCPLGVVLCVFEARPQVLPEVAALCVASGNALIFKGSHFSKNTLGVFHQIISDALKANKIPSEAVMALETRSDVSELLALDDHIDMVIPRGGRDFMDAIKSSTNIPVLGDPDGVCHVYVHSDADIEMAKHIIYDSKVEDRSGGNVMGSLLVHTRLWEDGGVDELLEPLLAAGIVVYAGPRARAMFKSATSSMPPARNMHTEYRFNACAVEVVESVEGAIEHIREFGSGHTDVIITEDQQVSAKFLKQCGSSCVFHNCSSRFSHGYCFGLGAEVGTSNKGHMRGPMGIEGLLTSKWVMRGQGHAVRDFEDKTFQYVHEKKCVTCGLQIRE